MSACERISGQQPAANLSCIPVQRQENNSISRIWQSIDWEWIRNVSKDYFLNERKFFYIREGDGIKCVEESSLEYRIRRASHFTIIIPLCMQAVQYLAAEKKESVTICQDFLDVLEYWDNIHPRQYISYRENLPGSFIFNDGNRGLYVYVEESDTENKKYYDTIIQAYKSQTRYPNDFPRIKKHGSTHSTAHYTHEFLADYFMRQGFNKTEARLLSLKAMYLCTQGRFKFNNLRSDAVKKAVEYGVFKLDCDFAFSLEGSDKLTGYGGTFLWRNYSVTMKNEKPYLALHFANFLPKQGVWEGYNKTILQNTYFKASAYFNLEREVSRTESNEPQLEWEIQSASLDEVQSFFTAGEGKFLRKTLTAHREWYLQKDAEKKGFSPDGFKDGWNFPSVHSKKII